MMSTQQPAEKTSPTPLRLNPIDDRILRLVLKHGDNVHTDELWISAHPFCDLAAVSSSVDSLVKLGMLEVASAGRSPVMPDYRPRRVLLTQKGHNHIRFNPPVANRLSMTLPAMASAGFLMVVANGFLTIQYMSEVGLMLSAAAVTVAFLKRLALKAPS